MSVPAQYTQAINDVVVGRDKDIARSVAGIATNPVNAATDAWFSILHQQGDATPLLTKHITVSAVAGVGQITDTGGVSGTALLVFQLLAADTAPLVAGWPYHWYVDLQTADGRKDLVFSGALTPFAP